MKLNFCRNGSCPVPTVVDDIGAIMIIAIFHTASLAFQDNDIVNNSKIAILAASLISGITGFLWLNRTLKDA